MESVTYVTALFDVRKHEGTHLTQSNHYCLIDAYLETAKTLLDTPFPFVIYCEPEFEAPLRAIRGDRPTQFKVCTFEQLPFWELFPTICSNNAENPVMLVSPEKFTPYYYYIINHKVEFVRQATEENPFATEWFAWVDVRITLPSTHLNGLTQWWNPERVNVIMMSRMDHDRIKDRNAYFRNNHGWIAGGFFSGKRGPLLEFTHRTISEWKRALEERYCPSDETMLTYMACANPTTVSAVTVGDYGDLIRNQAAVCNNSDRVYYFQEQTLIYHDPHNSIQAGESLRRAYLSGVLPAMANHEHFHIFYRLMLAYEKLHQTEKASERRQELQTRVELRPMVEYFARHLLVLPCERLA
jgi:hypothetical protein